MTVLVPVTHATEALFAETKLNSRNVRAWSTRDFEAHTCLVVSVRPLRNPWSCDNLAACCSAITISVLQCFTKTSDSNKFRPRGARGQCRNQAKSMGARNFQHPGD